MSAQEVAADPRRGAVAIVVRPKQAPERILKALVLVGILSRAPSSRSIISITSSLDLLSRVLDGLQPAPIEGGGFEISGGPGFGTPREGQHLSVGVGNQLGDRKIVRPHRIGGCHRRHMRQGCGNAKHRRDEEEAGGVSEEEPAAGAKEDIHPIGAKRGMAIVDDPLRRLKRRARRLTHAHAPSATRHNLLHGQPIAVDRAVTMEKGRVALRCVTCLARVDADEPGAGGHAKLAQCLFAARSVALGELQNRGAMPPGGAGRVAFRRGGAAPENGITAAVIPSGRMLPERLEKCRQGAGWRSPGRKGASNPTDRGWPAPSVSGVSSPCGLGATRPSSTSFR